MSGHGDRRAFPMVGVQRSLDGLPQQQPHSYPAITNGESWDEYGGSGQPDPMEEEDDLYDIDSDGAPLADTDNETLISEPPFQLDEVTATIKHVYASAYRNVRNRMNETRIGRGYFPATSPAYRRPATKGRGKPTGHRGYNRGDKGGRRFGVNRISFFLRRRRKSFHS